MTPVDDSLRHGIHLLTYHGLLAPAASYRNLVVPQPDDDAEHDDPDRCRTHHSRTGRNDPARRGRRPRRPRTLWADLLRRVFGFQILRCPCGGRHAPYPRKRAQGPRYLLTFLTDPAVVKKILRHLGIEPPPPAPHARPPPELAGPLPALAQVGRVVDLPQHA